MLGALRRRSTRAGSATVEVSAESARAERADRVARGAAARPAVLDERGAQMLRIVPTHGRRALQPRAPTRLHGAAGRIAGGWWGTRARLARAETHSGRTTWRRQPPRAPTAVPQRIWVSSPLISLADPPKRSTPVEWAFSQPSSQRSNAKVSVRVTRHPLANASSILRQSSMSTDYLSSATSSPPEARSLLPPCDSQRCARRLPLGKQLGRTFALSSSLPSESVPVVLIFAILVRVRHLLRARRFDLH